MLVGFVTGADQLTSIRVDEPQLVTRCWFDGAALKPGRTVWSERLWLKAGNNPLALLEAWAERLGQEMNARLARRPPTGWCPWRQFFGSDETADTEANLALIDEYDLPLDVILVDDGYQSAIGDWLVANPRFPESMKKVADRIRAAGHTPGIWTAPFGAAADSRLFAQHPGWFIQDSQGQPTVAWEHASRPQCYALDPTNPDAAAWLADTFRALRHKWGYTFFKIDHLFAAAVPGRRHDATSTRAGSLRRGLEIIREAVGDDAFLLACGAPQVVCTGLVDGMRIGPDAAPRWTPQELDLAEPAQLNALRNSIARAPFHSRLWLNDPDCLMVRRRGNDSNLLLNEVRTQVALTALLGGLTLDSDDLTRVRPGRLKYLRQALPPTGVSARPLDLFDNELPRTLLLPVERDWGRWWVAASINWQDQTVETTVRLDELGLPFDRYHVYDFWRRRYLGTARDEVILSLHRPHETRVLLFKAIDEQPDLLTSTFHVCQGTVEVKKVEQIRENSGLSLNVVLEKAGRQFGELLFTAPEPWQPTAASVNGNGRQLTSVAPGIVSLGLTLSGTGTITVDYES
jgi:alpha-galactosidase